MEYTRFVGLDVHVSSISVAVAEEGRGAAGIHPDGSFGLAGRLGVRQLGRPNSSMAMSRILNF